MTRLFPTLAFLALAATPLRADEPHSVTPTEGSLKCASIPDHHVTTNRDRVWGNILSYRLRFQSECSGTVQISVKAQAIDGSGSVVGRECCVYGILKPGEEKWECGTKPKKGEEGWKGCQLRRVIDGKDHWHPFTVDEHDSVRIRWEYTVRPYGQGPGVLN